MTCALSVDHLKGLKRGDVFTTDGIFTGLSDTPLQWKLVDGNQAIGEYVFEVTYYGVPVVQACATVRKGKKGVSPRVELEVL